MRKYVLSIAVILFGFSLVTVYHNRNENLTAKMIAFALYVFQESTDDKSIDSTAVVRFFKKYPNLKKHQSDVDALYKKRNYTSIWFDKKGLIEFANLLYSKVNQLEEEGLKSQIAYKEKIDAVFNDTNSDDLPQMETELMLSSMYVFYAKKVYKGIDIEKNR